MFGTASHEQSDSNGLTKRRKHHTIERLDVYVYSFDQSLNLDTDESYTLTVSLNTQIYLLNLTPQMLTMHLVSLTPLLC